jgi:NADH:ubiquinone oxidoreductase subunit E
VIEVECLGACDRGPVVMVNDDGWHERLSPEAVSKFVDDIRVRGKESVSGCHLHVEKE